MGSADAARTVSPHPTNTQIVDGSFSSLGRFTAPYLKGKPTQFEGKVTAQINRLMAASTPSPAKAMPEAAVVVRTRRTSGQQNAEWRNDIAYEGDTGKRHTMATKEATQMFVDSSKGDIEGSQLGILAHLNNKYHLDGEGRENSREKHRLSLRTIQRLVKKEQIGVTPSKKGVKPKISREFLRLAAIHINMEQVGVHGEIG